MNNFQGDLTDIVRGIGGSHALSPPETSPPSVWPPLHPPPSPSNIHVNNPFGDPFVSMTDPLLQELNAVVTNSSYLPTTAGDTNKGFFAPKVLLLEEDHMIKSQRNLRISQSNIIQDCDSPAMSARVVAAAAAASPTGIINVDTNSHRNCLLGETRTFSSQCLGLKKRKSQAKKVVCIPAPAAMNSRSSGEVVPSDLWAWRKYGQKPIKGSPYPRGYYRCSSSKGCSARKQVERSRTDPNMLVITYTSEHNHPWPIQRNALAGSARSSSSSSCTSNSSKSSNVNASSIGVQNNIHVPSTVKDERGNEMEFVSVDEGHEIASYKPELQHHLQHTDDFFADFEELQGDSLSLLLTQGCIGDPNNKITFEEMNEFFDWTTK